MFYAVIYNTQTGVIRMSMASAADDIFPLNCGEGEAFFLTESEIDNSLFKVDVEAEPPVLIPYTPLASQEELRARINELRQEKLIAGKTFGGIYVTGSDKDITNLTNLALGAQVRLGMGDTSTITTFRDGNNVDHALTPMAMLNLWVEASAHVTALYEASWALKDMEVIPQDVDNLAYWP